MPVGIATTLGSGSFNGLSFGPGTDFHVTAISGVNDLPEIRAGDVPRAFDDGAWSGNDFVGGRTVVLSIGIVAADNATLYTDMAALEAAFAPNQTTELPLLLFGSTRQINCRVRKRAIPYDAAFAPRTGSMLVELAARDPRIYNATLTTQSVGLGTVSGGFSFPISFPIAFGAVSTGGTLTATNNGNRETRPIITIAGPVSNPTVECIGGGFDRTLAFGITLAAGDTLVIDTDARTVVLNGTASRRNTLTTSSTWWTLLPGTSTINFRANSYQSGALMTMTYRDAWI